MSLSEEFIEAFSTNTSGCVEFCDCGVIHFHESDEWDWNRGELEGLRDNSEKSDEYISHHENIDSISFNGGRMVVGCRCNIEAEDFETFILKDSMGIARYLKLLFERQRQELETIKIFNEL